MNYKYLILLIGMMVRAILPDKMTFGFDQIQIARAGSEIASGNLALVGPRTGPANMFTGPLIYYFSGFFNLFVESHYAVYLTMLSISFLTGLALLYLSKLYLSQKEQLVILIIWACSPLMILFDQIPWNPNLAILSSSLVFFPLLKQKSQLGIKDLLFIFTGVFLGYQAHFSGLLLMPIAFLTVLLFFKPKLLALSTIVVAFILSFVPTFLFDYRNDWLNSRGFWMLISNKDRVASYLFSDRLMNKIYIVIETLGKVIFQSNSSLLILATGVLILGFYIFSCFKDKDLRLLKKVMIWLIAIPVAYAFYREQTPEYYFLILIPVFLHLISRTVIRGLSPYQQNVFLIFFVIIGISTSLKNVQGKQDFQLGAQLETLKYLQSYANTNPISQIIFDMDEVDALGIKYLMENKQVKLSQPGALIHIIYPTGNNFVTERISPSVGIWLDSRVGQNTRYLSTDDYIISIPDDWHIFQNFEPVENTSYSQKYTFFDHQMKKIGDLFVITKKDNDQLLKDVNLKIEYDRQLTTHNNLRTNWVFGQLLSQQKSMYLLNKDSLFVTDLIEPEKINLIFN